MLPALLEFFADPAVLIGIAGDGRAPESRRHYLTEVTEQTGDLRWDWQETVLFYLSEGALGFAAFGELVLVEGSRKPRPPIRATLLAVKSSDGVARPSPGPATDAAKESNLPSRGAARPCQS